MQVDGDMRIKKTMTTTEKIAKDTEEAVILKTMIMRMMMMTEIDPKYQEILEEDMKEREEDLIQMKTTENVHAMKDTPGLKEIRNQTAKVKKLMKINQTNQKNRMEINWEMRKKTKSPLILF